MSTVIIPFSLQEEVANGAVEPERNELRGGGRRRVERNQEESIIARRYSRRKGEGDTVGSDRGMIVYLLKVRYEQEGVR